jgi:hypothetical protein
MPESREAKPETRLKTIDIVRPLYGRRYTGLPVDSVDRQAFTINCTGAYMRPPMYDIQQGDTVRWQKNGRYVEATIASVERTTDMLRAELHQVRNLPEDFFPGG